VARGGNLRYGAGLLALILLIGLAAPWIATDGAWSPVPYAPDHIDLSQVLHAPSFEHWLGTDGLGRDLASRVIHGARVSLSVGLLAAAMALGLGIPLGAAAGYLGGWTDSVISRCIEAILCFPTLLLLLALLAASPPWLRSLPDALKLSLVIGMTAWVPVARYLRGEFLRLSRSDMVTAARAAGAGHIRIAWRHLLPASMAPVLVTASFTVAGAIGLEAAVSFIGLGIRPPVPSWGGLLTEARAHIDHAWWLALFPGIALFLTVLACNLTGEGIRDLLDPEKPKR
jgi:peptide/nickel transport system permease protein